MSTGKSTFRFKACLLFVSLLGTLAFLEMAVRLLGMAPARVKGSDALQQVLEFDEVLETHYVPNSTTVIKSQYGEFNIDYRFNELGLRERTIPVRAQDQTFRVLALGNSFVEGWGVAAEDSFLRVAEEALNAGEAGKKRVRLINSGSSGYGAAQCYLFLKKLLPTTRPDAVVFFYVPTMIAADQKFLAHASVDTQGLATGLDLDHFLSGDPAHKAAKNDAAETQATFLQSLGDYSALARLIDARLANKAAQAQVVAGDPRKDLLAAYRAPEQEQSKMAGPTFRHIEAMARFAREQGLPFHVVYLPMPFEVSTVEWNRGREIYGIAADKAEYQKPRLLATAALGSSSVDLVSTHEFLSQKTAQTSADRLLYFPFDFHLNKDGQRLLGEWLAADLAPRYSR